MAEFPCTSLIKLIRCVPITVGKRDTVYRSTFRYFLILVAKSAETCLSVAKIDGVLVVVLLNLEYFDGNAVALLCHVAMVMLSY